MKLSEREALALANQQAPYGCRIVKRWRCSPMREGVEFTTIVEDEEGGLWQFFHVETETEVLDYLCRDPETREIRLFPVEQIRPGVFMPRRIE